MSVNSSALRILVLSAFFVNLPGRAATFVWNVATPGANNWNVDANWLPGVGNPGSADTALFGVTGTAADALTVNNVVSVNTTITALSYTNNTSGTFHVTQIPASTTLTVSGTVTIGGAANNSTTAVAMVGEGTFVATGTAFTLGNGNIGSGSAAPGNLDLSGLSNFVYNASGGTIGIGTTGSRSAGNLTLAALSNSITAGTISVAGATGTGSTLTFKLGAGTNNINAGTINVGTGRSTTTFQFATSTGGLRLRGTGGTDADRTTMVVGNRNTAGTASLTTTGNVLLNGHPVDMKLSTLTLGTGNQSGNPLLIAVGNFNFDQGTVDVTTINMGVCSANNNTNSAFGTMTLTGTGTLLASAVSLANNSVSATPGTAASGTLNIYGGTAIVTNNIVKTTSASSTGVVAVASANLIVGGTIGSSAVPIDNLNLTNANLTIGASATATNVVANTVATDGAGNTVNISFVPAITGYPAQFPVIKYTSLVGVGFNLALGTLPPASPSYQGYLSNNTTTLTIDLVITNGPAPAQAITWSGAVDGDWETTKLNWLAGIIPTNYNNAGDFVTFNDSAANTTVSLVTPTLTPGSITVNNSALSYTFSGSGKLSGTTGLTKQGTGTLTLNNSGVNDFSGGVSLTGTLQVGVGGTSGNLPATGNVTNNGTLTFNRSDAVTVANAISGTGAVIKNGAGTLTLSGANTYSGGVTVNGGTLRPSVGTALGTGTRATVNSGASLVVVAGITNSFTLSNATFGVTSAADFVMFTNAELVISASSTNLMQTADPQNPATSRNIQVDGTLRGSGTILVLNNTNNAGADGGQGVRFRGTNVSDFSGTVIATNNSKAEMRSSFVGQGSPAGTGKFIIVAGAYYGTNGLVSPQLTGYTDLNIRNNTTVDAFYGNDVEIAGTGAAVVNPLSDTPAPSGVAMTLGNLKIGGGQELILYKASGNTYTIRFQSVTLTGGNTIFSPKSATFGSATSSGSDLALSNITEQVSGSGIIMAGVRTLSLIGSNGYTGNTLVTNGILALVGSSSLTNSPNITVSNTSAIDVNGRTDKTLALVGGQTLVLAGNGAAFGTNLNVGAGATVNAAGRIDGGITLTNGQRLSGNGTVIGKVVLTSGATVSPGTSVGTLTSGPITMGAGGFYDWEINNATGAAGTGYDLLNITGGIDVQSTSGNKFTIRVSSLNGSSPGPMANFNFDTSYVWTLASTTDSVTNFDASKFTVNYGAVSNDLAGGDFVVQLSSLALRFTNNHAPFPATTASFARPKDGPFKIKLTDLAPNWSDPDGDAVTLMSVNASSTNGVNNVSNDTAYIYYNPGTGGNVSDAINYTVRDVRGYRPGDTVRTASGTILITIAPDSTNQTHNITGISTNADGNVTINFAGIPNFTYAVEATTNLVTPVWVRIGTNVAGANGLWSFTDLNATNFPSRFYRSARP